MVPTTCVPEVLRTGANVPETGSTLNRLKEVPAIPAGDTGSTSVTPGAGNGKLGIGVRVRSTNEVPGPGKPLGFGIARGDGKTSMAIVVVVGTILGAGGVRGGIDSALAPYQMCVKVTP